MSRSMLVAVAVAGSALGAAGCGSSGHQAAPGHPETSGGAVHTWTDYASAGGSPGTLVTTGQTVQVACRVQGFKVADGDVWWYRLQAAPWNGKYYGSADAFYNNGHTSGSLHGTPLFDPAVPVCPA